MTERGMIFNGEMVRAILDGVSQQEIARRFGVSQSTVSAIKLGKVRRYG